MKMTKAYGPFRMVCNTCGNEFLGRSRASKRCPLCQEFHTKELERERARRNYEAKKKANPHPDIYCVDCGRKMPYVSHKKRCEECQEEHRYQWVQKYYKANIEKIKAYQKEYRERKTNEF